MWRALELAAMGEIGAHPNPMVGAVIVSPDGRIIGEGYHKKCGQAHAEVNAVADAESRGESLTDATIYVTLEPCAHYGKTPPCAKLLIDKKIPRVVIGMQDPFGKVDGKGIGMLREAGAEVTVLGGEVHRACRRLNRRFITAHTLKMPFVALKWAQSADGYIDRRRASTESPTPLSTTATRMAVHRYRSTFDAIAVGSTTELTDRPQLDARLWPDGRTPERVYFHRGDLREQLHELYSRGITSVLIEGGATLHRAFIDAGLWHELRVEISPLMLGSGVEAAKAPLRMPERIIVDKNIILTEHNDCTDCL